ncbi:MAG: GAF domain-containing sensor histidine kinase [Mojavia pulchra JT2-VF2]|uniref:Circadian input-output histidine kinase CikA n=1 Tax=Mojavia pulchra JT2-VF2 TaxID=287848 RepID=A0A951PWA0_9NOST|nr:GAF domain-containing sensor histidine kinase [Mojavia pulchra JT2-VF2]
MGKESIAPQLPQQLKIFQLLTNLTNQRLTHLPDLLEVIVKEVCNAVDSAQLCLIALYNPQTQYLELSTAVGIGVEKLSFLKLNDTLADEDVFWGRKDEYIFSHEPLNTKSGLLAQVFATGVSQMFQKIECVDENFSTSAFASVPCCCAFTPASMYVVAIESAQAGRLGVLAIGNWENPYAFNTASQQLLDAIGEVAAIAINNAKMLKTLEEREERLAKQNEILLEQNRELEKTRHQIQLQNLQLLEAANLKSQFLATTSHELRTPLNVILGLSQVLLRQRNSSLSEPQVEMVQRILNNGNHLLDIIEDMLYFAKVEAGRLSFQVEEFNLTTLVLTTVAEHRSLAEDKLLNLQLDINLTHPLIVNDRARLKQVLAKLLLNAIKFTETGSVEVKVWEVSSDRIAIAVQDTGIGIAESDLESIFEQLRQVDQSNTRKYGGMGLGLAITKSLVQIMQGTISVNSKLGQGSTFYIELPRQAKFED